MILNLTLKRQEYHYRRITKNKQVTSHMDLEPGPNQLKVVRNQKVNAATYTI